MNIFIAGQDIRNFGARLCRDYSVSGPTLTPTLRQGRNDSAFHLLGRDYGLITVTLPLDFYGKNVPEIAQNMAHLRGLCREIVEVSLGDGFRYRLCLSALGEETWTEDVLCSQTFTLRGQRLGDPITVSGKPPLTIFNPGTWEKTACKLTLTGFRPTANIATISLKSATSDAPYLTWKISKSSEFSGETLVLDGVEKCNSYGAAALPCGTMEWTEYPWLGAGEGRLEVSGASVEAAEVAFEPAYL